MSEIDYKKQCEHYERILGIGQYDPAKTAFLVVVKMMNQQVDYLSDFKINEIITKTDKDAPEYKRAMDMLDGLPKLITSVNELRSTLKLAKEDILMIEGNKATFSRITTPESIAENVGEKAGVRENV